VQAERSEAEARIRQVALARAQRKRLDSQGAE
jgi:hypothetical protein